VFNGDTVYISQLKRQKSKKVLLLLHRDVKLEFFPKSKLGSKKSSKNQNLNSVCPMFVKLVLTLSDGRFRNFYTRFDSNYERFLLENGWYGHAPIRSDTINPVSVSIRYRSDNRLLSNFYRLLVLWRFSFSDLRSVLIFLKNKNCGYSLFRF